MKKETVEEKQQRAITRGFAPPKSKAENVVRAWQVANWAEENRRLKPSEQTKDFGNYVAVCTADYVHAAMREWNPGKLIALARLMKASPKCVYPDKATWLLLDESKEGPVNLTKASEVMAERNLCYPDIRTLRTIARREGIKTMPAGRPKNK